MLQGKSSPHLSVDTTRPKYYKFSQVTPQTVNHQFVDRFSVNLSDVVLFLLRLQVTGSAYDGLEPVAPGLPQF